MEWLNKILDFIVKLFSNVEMHPLPAPEPTPSPASILPRTQLHIEALKWIGKDASPLDSVPDELACVDSLTRIISHVRPFPIYDGTYELLQYLKMSPHWRSTLNPDAGNVIVSATGTGNNLIRGHCGILNGDGRIMSNTSKTGKWELNYTIQSWVKRFRQQGGMAIYYFEPLSL